MSSIETLICNARIIDGTGNPWFRGEIGLRGDTIAVIAPPGTIPPETAGQIVDAGDAVVCPGFIDIQSHSILTFLRDGRSLSKITQGVTTEIMGEGWTPAPCGGLITDPYATSLVTFDVGAWRERMKEWQRFGDWLQATVDHGVSPNIGSFLGGGTLRAYAKGMAMGQASADELAMMKRVMAEAMEDGAVGVAYALIYPPDAYVETDEIVEVCKVVAQYNGVYISHVRSEAARLHDGIREAITIGRRAGCPVEIYHLKASGQENWHKMPEIITMINQARAEGIDVTADMYPYTASGTGLMAMFPTWVSADGAFFDNLRDPATRAQIRDEMMNPADSLMASPPESVMPIGFQKAENQPYVGKRLLEIAQARGEHWVDTAIELLLAEEQRIGTIYFKMSEENVKLQLQQPWNKVSTDAGGYDPTWGKALGPVHPRSYGTYPRVLGHYVREEKTLTLEDAIRKMTSSVADRLGLQRRGLLREGYHADLVIFDPRTVADRATFTDSHQLSVGIRDVWVNGTQVLRNTEHTGALPGKIVRGRGA
ncbi:MAG TPA: D-aminoacylase [Caldilineaceae bacterium]|nr:D-aminoacylase [Caldilineaceae bacterium]